MDKKEKLIDIFGSQKIAPYNYSDLIDRDKMARNDFYYFNQGYLYREKELLTVINLILEQDRVKGYPTGKEWKDLILSIKEVI